MKPELRKYIGLFATGLLAGLVAGGFIWGGAKPTVTQVNTVTVERTVTVEKVVTVDVVRTVFVQQHTTASQATITEEHRPDGTVVITSQYYGLGVTTEHSEQTQYHLGSVETSTEHTTASSHTAAKVDYTAPKWLVTGSLYVDPTNVLSFDYKRDWIISIHRRAWDSPFFLGAVAGPRIIGLSIGGEF